MFKILLSTTAIIGLSTTSLASLGYNLVQKTEPNSLEDFLREDIKNNKINLGKQGFIEYNNQRFTSENAFKKYLLSTSMIESQLTSSNPYKIIQDSSHMTLNPKKIYDLDIENFKQVYRDAYGNIAQNSFNALNTYANENFVQEKYSYDGIDWFTSTEEAKANQKKNLQIHKSLYYSQNGKYYNAFNPVDVQKLINTFELGYFINIKNDLSGNKLKSPIQMAGKTAKNKGETDIIGGLLKDELKKDFDKDYFYKISEIKLNSCLKVSAKGENEIRIDWFDGRGQQTYKFCTLLFPYAFKSIEEVLNYFKSGKWIAQRDRGNPSSPEAGRFFLEKDIELINPNTNSKQLARIKLVPPWSKWWWGTPNIVSFDDFVYDDASTGVLSTYLDEAKTEKLYESKRLNTPYEIQKIPVGVKDEAYDPWFAAYATKKLRAFGANENVDFSYDKLKNEIFVDNIEKNVYKDVVYDLNYNKGYGHSIIESYFQFKQEKENNILKQKPSTDENGIKRYKMWENFAATKEQLDNFLPLYGNNFFPVLKYSYGDSEDQISNDGKLLRDTYQEAQELAFINSNPSLKKKYTVYDVFRKNQAEGSTPEETLNALHNKIKLDSKLVNKSEIATWNWDKPIDYSDIISDGKYVVYKLKDKDESYIYFPTEELAISAAMESAKINGKVNNTYLDKYLYTYFDSATQKQFSVIFYNDEINSAILEIMNQLNN